MRAVASRSEVHEHSAHLRREALTMALYVAITLLAVLTVPDDERDAGVDVFAVVWGTTVGLALAHWCAFGLAARLVGPAHGGPSVARQLVAQISGAGAVAAVATVVIVLLPPDIEWAGARFAVAGCIGFLAYSEIRELGGSRGRALKVAIVALALAEGVAAVKRVLGH